MPTTEEWSSLIETVTNTEQPSLTAETFLECLGSDARPIKMIASDGHVYLVKGRQKGRVLVNEQIVTALGEVLHAPVAATALIDVPHALISAEPGMSHMEPGVSHASRWIDDCTDREGLRYWDIPENRQRFASLSVLYSWVQANDHQWIYAKAHPNLVYSVDHGHFFPGGPNWTVAGLRAAGSPVLDPAFGACGLGGGDYAALEATLRSVSPELIAEAVARPWHDWAITEDERVAMATYLDERRLPLADLIR